jgi:phosphatidate cytidylyltransferase
VPDTRGPESLARKPRSNLVTRILAALVLIPLALGTAFYGGWPFLAFWTAASLAIVYEWIMLVSRPGGRMSAITLAGFVYAGALLASVLLLRADAEYGRTAMLFLFAVVWSTDIAGYFVGRAFGGPKLMPRVSPNKTWSGAIGGTVVAIAASCAVSGWSDAGVTVATAILALVLSLAAQVGDLFESFLKRRFDAKDASKLIPGHGGVMDRLDGFIAAAAVAALLGLARGGFDAPSRGLMLW